MTVPSATSRTNEACLWDLDLKAALHLLRPMNPGHWTVWQPNDSGGGKDVSVNSAEFADLLLARLSEGAAPRYELTDLFARAIVSLGEYADGFDTCNFCQYAPTEGDGHAPGCVYVQAVARLSAERRRAMTLEVCPMTPSQAAQEEPTSPETPPTMRERLASALHEAANLPEYNLSQRMMTVHGSPRDMSYMDAADMILGTAAFDGFAAESEAAAATPSLPDRERLRIAIKSELGCYMPEQNDDCDHGVIAARVLARLDEGSATPDQGKGEPR